MTTRTTTANSIRNTVQTRQQSSTFGQCGYWHETEPAVGVMGGGRRNFRPDHCILNIVDRAWLVTVK
jgi:hypothetical protein